MIQLIPRDRQKENSEGQEATHENFTYSLRRLSVGFCSILYFLGQRMEVALHSG